MYTGIGDNISYELGQKMAEQDLIRKLCIKYGVNRIESMMSPYPKRWLAEKFLLGATFLNNEKIKDIQCDVMVYNDSLYVMPIEDGEL